MIRRAPLGVKSKKSEKNYLRKIFLFLGSLGAAQGFA